MEIKVLKFLGEDLIAEVLEETQDYIEAKNTARIVIIPNKTDPKNPTVGLAPYLEWTNDKVLKLSKNMFICMAEPLPMFVESYKKQFSNLILAESKIII